MDHNPENRMYLQGEMYIPERLAIAAREKLLADLRIEVEGALALLRVAHAQLVAAEQLADVVAHAIPLLQAGGRMDNLDYHAPARVALRGLEAALEAWCGNANPS